MALVASGYARRHVARFLPDGSLHPTIAVDAELVSSVCSGGPDQHDLHVTTVDAVLRTRGEAPGLPVPPARV